MVETFYITTPIYYVNAKPHLGHAYTTIVGDVARRFKEMQGLDSFFLTGTDEHGDKIIRAARKENVSPRVYVDKISDMFRALWPELNIKYDRFIRTTDAEHIAVVEHVLQKIWDSGDIYFSEYEGMYCFGCERFYTERELVDGKCPDHEMAPETIKESNYFFKMSRYQDWLIDHIHKHPDFIRPERYRNEVLAFLREPLEDLCISRPKSRLKWGITLPFDKDYVTYVWFDALLNYVSALNYPDGELYHKYWSSVQHIVAKDILKPHGIYWPIMLKAAGIPLYKHLNVHGYWNVNHQKMSKTLGNVAEPLDLKNIYGLDVFRFFLMREMAFGLDSNFDEETLIQRNNSDLANDLGNLFKRVITMTHKYFKGVIPNLDTETEEELQQFDSGGLKSDAANAISAFESAMENFAFHKAISSIWELVSSMNKYIDLMAPWELAKKKSNRTQLATVIYDLLEGLRVVSGLLYPFMPESSLEMRKQLGMDAKHEFDTIDKLRTWKYMAPGTEIPKAATLFPRCEIKSFSDEADNAEETGETGVVPPLKPQIAIDEFARADLRVATVLTAEPVPRAKKLLKLEVDIGEKRTVVAGIAGSYTPDEIVGKQVIMVVNLKPVKLMGIMSEGMILAAVDDKKVLVSTIDKPIKSGTIVK